jgi:hypothetical protein
VVEGDAVVGGTVGGGGTVVRGVVEDGTVVRGTVVWRNVVGEEVAGTTYLVVGTLVGGATVVELVLEVEVEVETWRTFLTVVPADANCCLSCWLSAWRAATCSCSVTMAACSAFWLAVAGTVVTTAAVPACDCRTFAARLMSVRALAGWWADNALVAS